MNIISELLQHGGYLKNTNTDIQLNSDYIIPASSNKLNIGGNEMHLSDDEIEKMKNVDIVKPQFTFNVDFSALDLDTLKKLQSEISKVIDEKSGMTFEEIYNKFVKENRIFKDIIIRRKAWDEGRTAAIKKIEYKEDYPERPFGFLDLTAVTIIIVTLKNKMDHKDGTFDEWESSIITKNEFKEFSKTNDWEVIE